MSLKDLVEQVSYVTDADGQPKAVQVEIDVWEQILSVLDDAINASGDTDTNAGFPVHPQRAAMKREIAAYEATHAAFVDEYRGQYVAIFQGQLVDHDADPVALHHRVTETYPGETVLCRQVQREASPMIIMRSPRLENV